METGADLLFQWVGRMIMLGLYNTDDVPFKDVYMHGMVFDEKGQKMSKSKGNVINPIEIVSQYGSDALRLGLIASRSAGVNQAFSSSKVIASRNLCNKLWNISRLIQDMVDNAEKSGELELKSNGEDWICREINKTNKEIQKLLDKYRFAEAGDAIYDLIWNKYADWFLEGEKLWKNTHSTQRDSRANPDHASPIRAIRYRNDLADTQLDRRYGHHAKMASEPTNLTLQRPRASKS